MWQRLGSSTGRIFNRILQHAAEKQTNLMYLFHRFDKDSCGHLSRRDFRVALLSMGVTLSAGKSPTAPFPLPLRTGGAGVFERERTATTFLKLTFGELRASLGPVCLFRRDCLIGVYDWRWVVQESWGTSSMTSQARRWARKASSPPSTS